MGFTKFIYNLINWKNKSESLTTPLGATNLNKMDSAIKKINDNLNSAYDEISFEKLDKSTAYTMVKDVTYNSGTGVFTVTKLNGTTLTIDTKLEKIVTNWKYDKDSQKLILTLDDGTTQEVDLSALITQYEFKDSDTIAFTVESDGSVTANVKDGSITDKKIQPNYLADIKTQASNAETSAQNASDYADDASYDAKLAQSYAIGGSGIRDGEETNNAKYYSEQANNEANNASGYAESASSFAENSSRSASYASSYANTASTHATNAEASAQSANKSANSASGYAENANTSAELANRSASYASSYANTASTHASNASASAQSASDSASAAEESAKNAKAEADKIVEIAGGDIVLQSEKGEANGVAPLDENALIPLEYVPDNPLLKDNASKNLLENTASSFTRNGVTFTVNNDKTISLSGTAVSDQSIRLGTFTFKANEKYIVSGSPTGGAEAKYFLYSAKTNLRDYGAGCETTFSQDTTEDLWFIVKSGTDVTGLTIKPMIRRAEITDDTYEPYYASNKELTEIVKEGSVNSAIQDGNGNVITDTYMTQSNPTGTGAFSMNRKANTDVGTKSSTLGTNNTASGVNAHAQGYLTEASGKCAHTEGMRTEASGQNAHAEGVMTKANGKNAHTEGESTIANGENSHAGGLETVAGYESQTVIGEYNDNKEENIFEVGNGSYDSTTGTVRSNALELTREGDLKVAGGFKGNADTATKAKQDANGLDIAANYMTIQNFSDQLPSLALKNKHSASTGGNKSFSVTVGSIIVLSCSNSSGSGNYLVIAYVAEDGVLSSIYKSDTVAACNMSLSGRVLTVSWASKIQITILS